MTTKYHESKNKFQDNSGIENNECVTFVFCHRFLLTAVAALSSYSIHLLLKSSGIVGKHCVISQCFEKKWYNYVL